MNCDLNFRRGLELHSARIDRLSTGLKAALAAACAQRQAEVYRAYARRAGAANAGAFDNLLNKIWDDIRCQQASNHEHKKWHDRGEKLVPNPKTRSDIYKAGAELAALSLLYSNSVLMTDKTQHTMYAAHQCFVSIDNFLTSSIGKKPEFDKDKADTIAKVLAHPLTEAEHCRQERDLFELEHVLAQSEMIPAAVDELRRRAEIEAKDFLPIIDGPAA
jgi:uncharacterized protein YjaG (DUF416 family)